MNPLLVGLGFGVLAGVLYAVAVALQTFEARQAPDSERLHHDLMGRLVARRRWLIGTLCAVLAWGLQIAALAFAPLTLVQPTLALALVVLLIIAARHLRERVGTREILGVMAIVAGIAGLAWSSPAGPAVPAPTEVLVAAILAFAVLAIAPYALRQHLGGRDWLITLAAGLGFAWAAQASKFVADAAATGAWALLSAALAAAIAGSVMGLLNEMTALQGSGAVRVYPTVLVIQIVVAVILAPVILGESWSGTPFGGLAVGVSLAVVVAGATTLAVSPALGESRAATS